MKYSTAKRTLAGALLVGGAFAALPWVQAQAQGIGLRKLDEMLVATPTRVERGKKIFAEQCASCHGADGTGNAPIGAQFDPPARGFNTAEYRFGGGPIAIYNAISSGKMTAEDGTTANHPGVFTNVAFQDRWAVTHYVRSLGPTNGMTDSAAAIEQARFEAVNGVCDEAIKGTISAKVQPGGEDQMAKAKEIYAAQCSSCHGAEGKGDGAAAGALKPPPRNFHSADEKWTIGSSPLGIFNTLTNGIPGTSMASYASLSEDERWALVHYLRTWVPEAARQESTDEQVLDVCRALSTPPKLPAIPLDVAMKALVADAPEKRELGFSAYGPVKLSPAANKAAGEPIYQAECASCHGVMGAGTPDHGPFGAFPPYLYLRVNRLVPAMAGGTTNEFAVRATAGVHTTLPDMTAASQLTEQQWRDLHAYVASFEGVGEVIVDMPAPVAPETATDAAPQSEQ
jgi:mono/diheme cytochrome c family protein